MWLATRVATGIDPEFLGLPLERLADAALTRAKGLGASHADFRLERVRDAQVRVRDAELEGAAEGDVTGYAVRVVHDGTWGFASGVDLSTDGVAAAADLAVAVARTSRPLSTERVELADEPAHRDVWISPYDQNPFAVPEAERVAVLVDWGARLLRAPGVDHSDVSLIAVQENKHYADLGGTVTTQQRVRVHPSVTVVAVDPDTGAFETLRGLAPPSARGWEYLTGQGWDWEAELAELPELLAERVAAPAMPSGAYDMVIDPSNLWLTIHESVGHATELDRALGYEAAYAGTSFATFDQLGSLRYGSEVMNVTGDRTEPHGLATVGYDDEGVAAQSWDLIRDGTLVGYQLDRRMARLKSLGRSNGCAFADAPGHVPIQRMANVSLRAGHAATTTADLISGVDDGVYAVGDKSWSIDMQRYNFQFTAQRFYRIRAGKLAGQVRDIAYQGVTPQFWGSLDAVGGPSTYVLGGAFNCGKGQPGQIAPVSHGCPSARFRGVRVLNTVEEGSA